MKRQLGKQEIADLLNKFMAGETSLDEENILAQYFRTHEVSDEWKEYKEMFALFDGGTVDVSLPLSPSKGRGTQSRFSSLSLWRGRGVRRVGAIAASIVIAFILWPNSPAVVEQQPIVAEAVEQPAPEAPKASDYSESSEYSDYSDKSEHSEPIKAKRTYKSRKVSKPQEEPLLAQADPLPEEPVISTQTAEPVAEYQSVQTIRFARDQVVFVVRTSDVPMMANMPSVGELRARGQQLLANVQQQINEASKQF